MMALNSYITKDGKEIGRAQGIQAEAAGVEATTNMNPVLIKPTREYEAQVVVHGVPLQNMYAYEYRKDFFETGREIITKAYEELASEYEHIVIEGAGSPAEINLNDRELVNMRVADIAQSPVILVGDIDKGGVFASLVGTIQLLPKEHKSKVVGVIINKFRGDLSLLQPGLDWFEEYTGLPVLGVVPYLDDVEIDAEDSLALTTYPTLPNPAKELDVAVISYPRMSNFTDLDPIRFEDDCHVRLVTKPSQLGTPDLIILPGSKNTLEDAKYLYETGLAEAILTKKNKVDIAGICGGYQILGEVISDPNEVESTQKSVKGLGLLPIETVMKTNKRTERVTGRAILHDESYQIEGYEIHMGETTSTKPTVHFAELNGIKEGAVFGRVIGTYIHDVFHNDGFRRAYLNDIRQQKGLVPIKKTFNSRARKEESFQKLAAHVRKAIDMKQIYEIMSEYKK
ncbi:cobyric acid synthase [Priestia flexa]|uniref:cobyric acid synthase n=1 Tax=Priestia flexa TaxID=86664 RepID=UPI000C236E9B|nr:cobyric acid synthase [Priestia flexa]MEC0668170.1 cobyric acid synthase [Priestia flexa]